MKLCLAEAIKRVKMLNEDVSSLLSNEESQSSITYRDETEKITYDYNFDKTREQVANINSEILTLKRAINKANNETTIGVDGYTISDGLIKIAMIRKELTYHLEPMARKDKLSSRVDMRNDGLIYTELLYNPDECKEYVRVQKELLNQIQMGIDRANLTTFIDV